MHECACVGVVCTCTMYKSHPLEMELQVVVNCLMWVMGTELWSSEREKSFFNF